MGGAGLSCDRELTDVMRAIDKAAASGAHKEIAKATIALSRLEEKLRDRIARLRGPL